MPTFVLFLFRFARLLFSGHAVVAVENTALRLQLAAFQRKRKRPVLRSFDRLFWVGLSLLWHGWRAPLVYVRRHCCPLATRPLSQILGTAVQGEPASPRQTRNRSSDSTPD